MQAERSLGKVSRSYQKYIREMNIAKNEMERWYKNKAAREAGHAEGCDERDREIARKMKARDYPLSEIVEVTGLPLETVEQI